MNVKGMIYQFTALWEILRLFKGIDRSASVSISEAVTLFNYVRNQQLDGNVVELGAYKGRSTVCLAGACKLSRNGRVYTIDRFVFDREAQEKYGNPPETETIFDKNIQSKNLQEYVVKIKGTFEDVARQWRDRSIRLLFIDGGHTYEMTMANCTAWEPFVKVGGIIAFHDSVGDKWPGVKKAVDEIIRDSKKFVKEKVVGSTTFAKKVR